MRIENTGYVSGITETYLAYVMRVNSPKREDIQRQEPAEYRINPIEKTVEIVKYDSRGNLKRDTNLGGIVNKLA